MESKQQESERRIDVGLKAHGVAIAQLAADVAGLRRETAQGFAALGGRVDRIEGLLNRLVGEDDAPA